MTNYNERLDEMLSDYAEAICSYAYFGSPFNSDEDNIAGAEALYQTSQNEAKQAIQALNARQEAEIVDRWVAHVLEDIYPLDVFPKETGGGHVAGIYHGMHILRREVRGLSARDDLDYLPQETEQYYKEIRAKLTPQAEQDTTNTKGGEDE